VVKPNTSERVEPSPLISLQKLKEEIPKEHTPKVPLLIKMVLGESPYEGNQPISGTSLEYDRFELSYDEFVEIFSELIRPTHYFDVLPKIFNNSLVPWVFQTQEW